MLFAWHEAKNRINERKHGVSSKAARRAFNDAAAVSYIDAIIDGEERWHTIGMAAGISLLLVVHTVEQVDGEEKIRIISARKANSRERSLFDSSF